MLDNGHTLSTWDVPRAFPANFPILIQLTFKQPHEVSGYHKSECSYGGYWYFINRVTSWLWIRAHGTILYKAYNKALCFYKKSSYLIETYTSGNDLN